MVHIVSVTPDVEMNPWTDLEGKIAAHGELVRAGALRNGTTDGRATVALVAKLDSGELVVIETTWRLFKSTYVGLSSGPVIAEEIPD